MAGTLKLVWRDFENGAEKGAKQWRAIFWRLFVGAHFLAPTPRFL